jgi:hypothetical protein
MHFFEESFFTKKNNALQLIEHHNPWLKGFLYILNPQSQETPLLFKRHGYF